MDWVNETINKNSYDYHSNRNSWNNSEQMTLALQNFMHHQSRQHLNDKSPEHQQDNDNTFKKQKYNSCPDLNHAFGSILTLTSAFQDDEDDASCIEKSWSSHYQTHLNKQKSMANLNSLGVNTKTTKNMNNSRNNLLNISPARSTQQHQNQVWNVLGDDAMGMRNSSFSLYSSLDSLLNGEETKKCSHLKELRIRGKQI